MLTGKVYPREPGFGFGSTESFRSWNTGNLKPFGFLAKVIGNRM